MKTVRLALPLAGLALAAGCWGAGPPPQATLRGRVVDAGEPIAVRGRADLVVHLLTADGKIAGKSWRTALRPDGSFALTEAGGVLEPGAYLVTFDFDDRDTKAGLGKYVGKHYDYPQLSSKLRLRIEPGPNDVVIDIAKPAE